MELQSIKVSTRAVGGKGAATKIRATGFLPAVLYGGDKEPVSLKLNLHRFEQLVQGRGGDHAIVQIEVENDPEANTPALLKAVQRHPAQGNILHVDFLRIRLDERISTVVPLHLVGQPVGVVEGGIVDQQLHELEIECLALDVPDELVFDISDLGIGESIHASQITVPDNVTLLTDPERAAVAIHAPRVLKEEKPEEEEGEEQEAESSEGEGEKAEKEEEKK